MTHGTPEEPLYRQIARRVEAMIDGGTFGVGDRIPSVRKLSRQLSVSVTTVVEAYRLLEDRQRVVARPQSGYYVRSPPPRAPEPRPAAPALEATAPEISDLVLRFLHHAHRPDLVPLGAAVPHPDFLPVQRLNRLLVQAIRREPRLSQAYDDVQGLPSLRVQVGRRALEAGCSLAPDEIVTTSGAQAAVHLCLGAVTRPGDTVVVESPTYYGLLEALESLHLRALEVPTDPRDGVCLPELLEVLDSRAIAAVALAPSFGNPLGHCMPDSAKRSLVEELSRRRIPLVEDDIYGELPFEGSRPRAAKAFDREGWVLLCSSFSKSVAPGYRIGWTAPGRFLERVQRLKFSSSVATATPTQMALAAFLEEGGFDRTLRRLRRQYRDLVERFSHTLAERFPEGTRVSRPGGGHVLWVEMPPDVDSVALHEAAIGAGISVAPGVLFSTANRYRNCIRLNCALPWSGEVEAALVRLGGLVAAAAQNRT